MNNLQAMENDCNIQSTVCSNSDVDVESIIKVKTTPYSIMNLNVENPNANITNSCSDETNNDKPFSNEEQVVIVNNSEQSSPSQTVMQVCTESLTDNEQINVLKQCDVDVNKNVDIKKHMNNCLEDDISVIVNENAVSNAMHDAIKELESGKLESEISCSVISSKTLVSSNSQSTKISPQNDNTNTFGLIPDPDLSLFPSNSVESTDFISSTLDNSIVISNSNAVPQSDSIVSSNFSLSQLKCYGSDESLNEDSLEVTTCYRDTNNEVDLSDKESDSDSSSSSSSSSILISDSSDSDSDADGETITLPKPIKAKGELDLNDLPPIEDLKISVAEQDCIPVGQIFQIVGKLVVIQAFKDIPALNLDTVLFLQEGKPFGKIFDVFGPVAEPYYCVRFNSNDDIKDKNISINQVVYCAPKTKYTNYVFLAQLLALKGSDASWVDDLEPPAMFLEYSDDEQEQKAKKKLRKNAKNKEHSDPDEPASKKHFSYERKMNKRNLQISAARKKPGSCQIENSLWSPSSTFTDVASSSYCSIPNVPHQIFGRPPAFTARIPSSTGYCSSRPGVSTNPTIFPTTPNMYAQRSNRFPPSPDMFPPRPNIFPPRPEMFPPRPDMFPPRPDMFPPRPNMFPPRPNMLPPRPDIFPPKLNIFPPRPDMFPPRPDMLPPRPPMLQSRPSNFLGTNNLICHPPNSFQSPSPNRIDSYCNNFSQPNFTHGPVRNHQSLSTIGPPRLGYSESNQRFMNPYPNHPGPPLPTGNLWLQRPQSPSLNSPSPSLRPPPQPNNSSQVNPRAYPHSNPF